MTPTAPSVRRRAAALLAAALALTACAGGTADRTGPSQGATPGDAADGTTGGGDLPQLTVGLTYTPDIQFSPFYLGVESGAFERAGVDVTLRHHGGSESLFGALEAGEEDVVFAGGAEVMQARAQWVDVVDIATLYQDYPVVLIVPEESPIHSVGDLAGASVGVPGPYGETWFGLLAMLDEAGLAQEDVDIENIGFTQQAALTTGAMDAVVGYSNNDAVQLEAGGFDVRTLGLGDGGGSGDAADAADAPLVGAGLAARSETVDEDAHALEALVAGLREVMAGPGRDADAVVDAAREYVPGLADGGAADRARETWLATLPLYGEPAEFGVQDAERWEAMSEFMDRTGLVAAPVPAGEAYTSAIVGSAP